MLGQLAHRLHRVGAHRPGLHLKPFVEHERIVAVALVEDVERMGAFVAVAMRERRQRRLTPVSYTHLDVYKRQIDRNVDPAMRNLRDTLASANKSMQTLESAISDARPGLKTFSETTIPEANALIRDLRRTSSSLSSLSLIHI